MWRNISAISTISLCLAIGYASSTHADTRTSSANVTKNIKRTLLTYDTLQNGTDPDSPVDLSAYAVPANAFRADSTFEGTLELIGEATSGGFDEIKDTFRYTGRADTTRKHLPEFNFKFFQVGNHIVPVQRGAIPADHPEWEYILEAGRAWKEKSDNGFSRAAIPFALEQKNANCMHNGVLTFLFKEDGSTSKAAYQISSETCLYFKFDMWGLLDSRYTPAPIGDTEERRTAYKTELNNRLPAKPITELSKDYPGANPSEFGSPFETDPNHVTVYGFVIDGTNYIGGCNTRHGTYPYCTNLVLPSYSSAKSIVAGMAMMRLELKYPGYKQKMIAGQVPECQADGNWNDVTYDNALDMATGNYGSSQYTKDEGSSHIGGLFLPLRHADKIAYSCGQYSRKAEPGTKWVYHSSDTYILGTAMNADIKEYEGVNKDVFSDTIVNEILKPIGTSPTSWVSRRTYDAVQQPFAGYGLSFVPDDIAKISNFLNVDGGKLAGQPLLDQKELSAAMQQNPHDKGVQPLPGFLYNNGFWAHEITNNLKCQNDIWVPFMSGYGGISVLLLPNDTTYYMFSDNDTFLWMRAARESQRIRSMCS